jgi:GLPGLI family protein
MPNGDGTKLLLSYSSLNIMKSIRTFLNLLLFIGFVQSVCGQIEAGKIVFERKTNLEKKFKDVEMRHMMKDMPKSKIDVFELLFNDSCSLFSPVISDIADPSSWATTKNIVYQNFNQNSKLTVMNFWGQEVILQDSNYARAWKITPSKRMISGYNCTKAVWQKNDSTRIYAWFCPDIVPSVGPEGFDGLPGAILGLATEDGGIIYFAKSVEILVPNQEKFLIETKKKKVYTMAEFKYKIETEYSKSPWGKRIFDDLFRWF